MHSVCFVCVAAPEDQIPHGFPTIDMGPQLKVVERTRTATMLCAASGNPDPEIFWFKDFLPVDIGSSNGRIKQLRSGTVPVHNASTEVFRTCNTSILRVLCFLVSTLHFGKYGKYYCGSRD